eukprot:SAG22_NODE_17_length_32684_cov_34.234095_17_plen_405_part_00
MSSSSKYGDIHDAQQPQRIRTRLQPQKLLFGDGSPGDAAGSPMHGFAPPPLLLPPKPPPARSSPLLRQAAVGYRIKQWEAREEKPSEAELSELIIKAARGILSPWAHAGAEKDEGIGCDAKGGETESAAPQQSPNENGDDRCDSPRTEIKTKEDDANAEQQGVPAEPGSAGTMVGVAALSESDVAARDGDLMDTSATASDSEMNTPAPAEEHSGGHDARLPAAAAPAVSEREEAAKEEEEEDEVVVVEVDVEAEAELWLGPLSEVGFFRELLSPAAIPTSKAAAETPPTATGAGGVRLIQDLEILHTLKRPPAAPAGFEDVAECTLMTRMPTPGIDRTLAPPSVRTRQQLAARLREDVNKRANSCLLDKLEAVRSLVVQGRVGICREQVTHKALSFCRASTVSI